MDVMLACMMKLAIAPAINPIMMYQMICNIEVRGSGYCKQNEDDRVMRIYQFARSMSIFFSVGLEMPQVSPTQPRQHPTRRDPSLRRKPGDGSLRVRCWKCCG